MHDYHAVKSHDFASIYLKMTIVTNIHNGKTYGLGLISDKILNFFLVICDLSAVVNPPRPPEHSQFVYFVALSYYE